MRIQVTAWSGHTAYPGHTGGPGTELYFQVTDSDLGNGIRDHMDIEINYNCVPGTFNNISEYNHLHNKIIMKLLLS